MNTFTRALRRYFHGFGRRSRPEGKPLPEPEAAYGKPAPMTGLWSTLTDDQKAFVLDYKGSDEVGDRSKFEKA